MNPVTGPAMPDSEIVIQFRGNAGRDFAPSKTIPALAQLTGMQVWHEFAKVSENGYSVQN